MLRKGFVFTRELAKNAGVSTANFHQIGEVELSKMGGISIVRVESLPQKYKEFAKSCTNIEKYTTMSDLEKDLGMYKDSLYYHMITKNNVQIPYIKIERSIFLILPDEFLELKERGMIPFQIKDEEDEKEADLIIDMHGLRVGFY